MPMSPHSPTSLHLRNRFQPNSSLATSRLLPRSPLLRRRSHRVLAFLPTPTSKLRPLRCLLLEHCRPPCLLSGGAFKEVDALLLQPSLPPPLQVILLLPLEARKETAMLEGPLLLRPCMLLLRQRKERLSTSIETAPTLGGRRAPRASSPSLKSARVGRPEEGVEAKGTCSLCRQAVCRRLQYSCL